MKIRTDFVTNSSSSSFVISRKGELNDKQKEAILEYVERRFLSGRTMSKEDVEEYCNEYWTDEDAREEMRKCAENNENILRGRVSFEEPEYDLAEIYQEIWEIVQENSDGNFVLIDGNLDY